MWNLQVKDDICHWSLAQVLSSEWGNHKNTRALWKKQEQLRPVSNMKQEQLKPVSNASQVGLVLIKIVKRFCCEKLDWKIAKIDKITVKKVFQNPHRDHS